MTLLPSTGTKHTLNQQSTEFNRPFKKPRAGGEVIGTHRPTIPIATHQQPLPTQRTAAAADQRDPDYLNGIDDLFSSLSISSTSITSAKESHHTDRSDSKHYRHGQGSKYETANTQTDDSQRRLNRRSREVQIQLEKEAIQRAEKTRENKWSMFRLFRKK